MRTASLFFKKIFRAILCVHFLLAFFKSNASILPANGAVLNYTQVMFEYEEVPRATRYILVVSDQQGHVVTSQKNASLALLVRSGIEFGREYHWHYEAFNKNKPVFKSEEYHFSTRSYFLVDTAQFRTRVLIKKDKNFQDNLVFLDYTATIVDRNGKPVWFYPYQPNETSAVPNFRNMRMSNEGTVTYQDNNNCYEVNLQGELVWQGPNDGRVSHAATEFYHHDFRKLADGTYMACSYEFSKEPNFFDPTVTTSVRYNTLIQYDAGGDILWSWNEKDHVSKKTVFRGYSPDATSVEGTHMNGFDYDAVNDGIVMSFRNNSSIIRIDKKTGNIIYAIENDTVPASRVPMFARQHGPVVLPNNQVLIYNNNVQDSAGPSLPFVLVMNEPKDGKPATIAWQYEFRPPGHIKGLKGKEGYATPLPNGNFLVCAGGANCSAEISRDKEITWEAIFEKYDPVNKTWTDYENYRTNFSSSLYPKYYTLQHAGSKNIRINNEGTDEDSYTISITEEGKPYDYSAEISIPPGSSRVVKIPMKGKHAHISIFVTSKSITTFSKYISYEQFPAKND
jgi:hypothetical protein